MTPCVFFDRDGIVNEPPPDEDRYVLGVDRFHLIPAFLDALRVTRERGYKAIIVTNQKCIARGLLTHEQLTEIHDHLLALVRGAGLALEDIYFSPHAEDDHPERKPNPGMLLKAAKEHDIDLAKSWMIGDNEKDVQAGQAAGCAHTIRVCSPDKTTRATAQVCSMSELADYLRTHLPPTS